MGFARMPVAKIEPTMPSHNFVLCYILHQHLHAGKYLCSWIANTKTTSSTGANEGAIANSPNQGRVKPPPLSMLGASMDCMPLDRVLDGRRRLGIICEAKAAARQTSGGVQENICQFHARPSHNRALMQKAKWPICPPC